MVTGSLPRQLPRILHPNSIDLERYDTDYLEVAAPPNALPRVRSLKTHYILSRSVKSFYTVGDGTGKI